MIDVVIPARNEADTIGPVVQAFHDTKHIRTIIVVVNPANDDATRIAAVNTPALTVLSTAEGKGQAVNYGMNWVETEWVGICDSDLTGLTPDHVWQIIADAVRYPLFDSMVIGVPDFPDRSPVPWSVRMDIFALMAGQRCLPTRLVRGLDLHGYAMEEQINRAITQAGIPFRFTRLEGVKGKVRENSRRMAELRRDREWLIRHSSKS